MVEESRAGGGVSATGVLDGQLEGDVHLGFFSQRHDFRQLDHLSEHRWLHEHAAPSSWKHSMVWLQCEWEVDCPLAAVRSTAQSQIINDRMSTPTLTQHFPQNNWGKC